MSTRRDGKTNDSDWNLTQFAAKIDSTLVNVTVPKDYAMTMDFVGNMNGRLVIPAGTTQLPASVANHPWSRQNGVH